MLSQTNNTYRQQAKLANYCRTGKYEALQNVNEKNVSQYRRLVFNGVEDMLQTAYPLTFELLTNEEWQNITKEFFANHACSSPQVWYMPKEFYEYLSGNENHFLVKKYPFIIELLWFEWLEVELYMMEDKTVDFILNGNIKNDLLVINPETELLYFTYPVHLKNAKEISEADKGNYFLSLHRMPDNGEINFTSLSPALFYSLQLLAESPMKIDVLANIICTELNIGHTNDVDNMLQYFVEQAMVTKLILGYIEKPVQEFDLDSDKSAEPIK